MMLRSALLALMVVQFVLLQQGETAGEEKGMISNIGFRLSVSTLRKGSLKRFYFQINKHMIHYLMLPREYGIQNISHARPELQCVVWLSD